MCGERFLGISPRDAEDGSSPRVRGTLGGRLRARWHCRFIPACAGNAGRIPRTRRDPPVHPRVCGERIPRTAGARRDAGSSPRVRGTPLRRTRGAWRKRFIPACAGNAGTGRPAEPLRFGSSPRVRGTLHRDQRDRPAARFIPACAGNASKRVFAPSRSTVHPRVCGERSSHNLLIDESYPNMSLSTGKFGNVLLRSKRTAPLSYARSIAGARKRTSFMPSKSVGVRRLTPQVSKS